MMAVCGPITVRSLSGRCQPECSLSLRVVGSFPIGSPGLDSA
jgi:hypothetical protein